MRACGRRAFAAVVRLRTVLGLNLLLLPLAEAPLLRSCSLFLLTGLRLRIPTDLRLRHPVRRASAGVRVGVARHSYSAFDQVYISGAGGYKCDVSWAT